MNNTNDIDNLIHLLSRLPGLGRRSAKRATLHLLKKRTSLMEPLSDALKAAAENVKECAACSNLSLQDPCPICTNIKRDHTMICVVENVDDLWALERTNSFKGIYHVLGGTLSALEGVRPEDLKIASLINRIDRGNNSINEIIMALSATVDGQATAHYVIAQLKDMDIKVTHLSHGVPVGGELDYLDDGTLTMALESRRSY